MVLVSILLSSSDLVIELNPIRKNKKTVKEIVENFLILMPRPLLINPL